MPSTAARAELARCKREQAEIDQRPDVRSGECPAWLAIMGWADWEIEQQLILAEQEHVSRAQAAAGG